MLAWAACNFHHHVKCASKVCTKAVAWAIQLLQTSLKLPLLKERRAIWNLSALYKYLNGLAVMPPTILLPSPTRGRTCSHTIIFICIGRLHTQLFVFLCSQFRTIVKPSSVQRNKGKYHYPIPSIRYRDGMGLRIGIRCISLCFSDFPRGGVWQAITNIPFRRKVIGFLFFFNFSDRVKCIA